MKNTNYLFPETSNAWNAVALKIRSASDIYIFLDYDGTLTPIRRIPSAAILSTETEDILLMLTALPHVRVAIVTGRSMEDIKRLVPIDGIGFAANHGFHICDRGKEWIHPDNLSLIKVLSRLYLLLCSSLERFPKVIVENKQFTLSIHYRNVSSEDIRAVKSLVSKIVGQFDLTLRLTTGKKVLEVRPQINWGKGQAILKMLGSNRARQQLIPIFIGDDATDEDVYQIMQKKGITIRVGKSLSTNARYILKDVNEVVRLLQLIISIRKNTISNRIRQKQAQKE